MQKAVFLFEQNRSEAKQIMNTSQWLHQMTKDIKRNCTLSDDQLTHMNNTLIKYAEKLAALERLDEEKRNMLEDVVNELCLSENMNEKHGQFGTPPAELVRLVLERKDLEIRATRQGFKSITV